MNWWECESLILTQMKFDKPNEREVLETHVYERE